MTAKTCWKYNADTSASVDAPSNCADKLNTFKQYQHHTNDKIQYPVIPKMCSNKLKTTKTKSKGGKINRDKPRRGIDDIC